MTMRTVRRSSAALAIAAALVMVVGACVPPTGGGGAGTTTTTVPATWTPGPCPSSSGVTVVVDFAGLHGGRIEVRCALGAQASGLVALANAGFVTSSESGAGTICTVDGFPTQGFPFCWLTGGYWSYWRAPSTGAPWAGATTGAGAGPLAQGTVEGWAWAPGFVPAEPGVGSDGS